MKRILFFVLTILLGTSLFSQSSKYSKETYDDDWKIVSSHESNGLSKSALEEVQKIYQKAKKDKNPSGVIKAILHRFKYNSQISENSFVQAIQEIETELKDSDEVVQSILHSIVGEMYWNYYQNNRYYYLQRTSVANLDLKDIKTWDLKKIVEVATEHYEKSLKNEDILQNIQIDLMNSVLHKAGRSEEFRPTLYDFVAHRALDFFINSESSLTRPADYFTLDDKKFFHKANEFIKLKVQTNDTLSFKYKAVLIFQKLLSFHLNKQNQIAQKLKKEDKLNPYMDVELKRLKFIHTYSNLPEKEKFYFHALKNLEDRYSKYNASTQATYHIAQIYSSRAPQYIPQNSTENKTAYIRAYQKCQEAIVRFPNSDGSKNCASLQASIKNKELSLQIEKHSIPNKPSRISVDYRNLHKLYIKAYSWTKKDQSEIQQIFKEFHKKWQYPEFGTVLADYVKKLEPVAIEEYSLPKDDDYHKHTVEIKAPSLSYGNYILIASDNEKLDYQQGAIAYTLTNVTNFSYIYRDFDGEREFHILDRTTGSPLSNVKATAVFEAYNNRTSLTEEVDRIQYSTGQVGEFKVPLKASKDYRSYYVILEKGEDTYNIQNDYYELSYYETNRSLFGQYSDSYNPSNQQVQNFVHFFTDRAIYRPGQQIYYKGVLLLKNGDKVLLMKNTDVTVYLYNVNSQLISQSTFKSNEFGTVSGAFTAPTTGLLGNMSITASIGGSTYISVEEYKRPKFEVTMDNIKGAYKLSDTVKISGHAKAYSGANIDGAKVKYRIIRNAVFPYWWWTYYGYYPTSPQIEISNGETKTDENGKFSTSFSLIPDSSVPKESSPIFSYTVLADVTDINGETRSTSQIVSAGYQALVIHSNLSEKVDKNLNLKFNINTTNLSGEFESTKVQTIISKLKSPDRVYRSRMWKRPDKFLYSKQEWEDTFKEDAYNDEDNMYKWQAESIVYKNSVQTTKQTSIEINTIQKWKSGAYKVEILGKDKFNQDVKEVRYFTLFAKDDSSPPVNHPNWFYSNKKKAEPGDNAEILVGASGPALYEIENRGKVIHQEWIYPEKNKNVQKSLSFPIIEEHRGNISVHYTFVKNNRLYTNSETIVVPYTNKELDIEFETFRSKLTPGEKEEWRLKIKGKQGEKVSAEMVATLYDASLDAFQPNNFHFSIYNSYYASLRWNSMYSFNVKGFQLHSKNWNPYFNTVNYGYDSLNWFGYNYYSDSYYRRREYASDSPMMEKEHRSLSKVSEEAKPVGKTEAISTAGSTSDVDKKPSIEPKDLNVQISQPKKADFKDVQVRKNFNETAFFYPNLQTDENGNVLISFTIPESLTKWKMLGFAHTEDLKFGLISNELTTSKDLMVVPNEPRFFREGDKLVFSTKITNISDVDLNGSAKIEFFDALSNQPVSLFESKSNSVQNFSAKKGQSTVVNWNIKILDGLGALTYRVVAKSIPVGNAKSHSDGEEKTLPVLTDRMMVTETLPLNVKGNQSKTFTLDKLLNNTSDTLRHHKLTLEYTPTPVWYAVQSLPYIMEYPYECAEQTFNRLYSNSISTHIIDSVPNIKRVFEQWKNPDQANQSALLSNLEKNQELKLALLEDTPWVLDAKDESERKKRIAVLFDVNRMSSEMSRAIKKLKDLQGGNGAYSWFKGMPEDRYITQYILTGFARLSKIGVKSIQNDSELQSMNRRTIQYLDTMVLEDYKQLKYLAQEKEINLEDNHLSHLHINYLYTRSYFTDLPVSKESKEAFDYYFNQSKKYWTNYNNYLKGMIAIYLHRYQDRKISKEIVQSLRETSTVHEELGMYWKETYGYYWYELPIEKQALMIEVFYEVAGDEDAVNELKVWLLKQKQTSNWKTTKATSDAIYALLLGGNSDWISQSPEFKIQLGKEIVQTNDPKLQKEAGTGYFKVTYNEDKISNEMGRVVVTPISGKNTVSWGGLYWQYFEKLDKITGAETPLKLKRQLFIQKNTKTGPVLTPITENNSIQVGDLVKVRIELRVDRNMEYVHMKDMRASGLEPTNVISQYKWQDGLGYYESTRDSSTNFFFSYLPKGTFVFEYGLRATHKGEFSNGITQIQCMYAPEFASHSDGLRIKIK